ncbi:MAG TPA: hypothetical protein VFV50_11400 [Bdellovibrionales bacterium]|nr:hypothetical protein [Bdellovibrionales bacterium]
MNRVNVFYVAAAALVVAASFLLLPVTVFESVTEESQIAIDELARSTGLACRVRGPPVYKSLTKGVFSPDLSVTCASTNFAFSDGRDGTSKDDFGVELLKRYREDAEAFYARTGLTIGLAVSGYGYLPLTCYRPAVLVKGSRPEWHVCRGDVESGCNYGDCEAAAF